jgi:phage shock protein PspC (stress-responsive transcriptional regulator)
MNKVITINLSGNAYQLEEGGYDALRVYLETAAARLQGNPDCDEILSDIEQAIAEKFRARLTSHKSVVLAKEVGDVLKEMGPIEPDIETSNASASGSATGSRTAAGEDRAAGGGAKPKRLYRIREGEMLAGVCNGIAAYIGIDPTLVRLAFVFLTIFWGTGLLVYIVLAIVVPEASTPEEKAAASGSPTTAQEFIRRAKEGYYEAMKNFPDHNARREWARKFRRDVRAGVAHWRYNYSWPGCGQSAPSCHPGMGFTLPILSLLSGAVAVLWICALISLLANGAVFGMALPTNVPVWVAALVLFIAYAILGGSLKAARRVYYCGMGPAQGAWSVVFLLDAVVWCVVVAVLLWLAIHYFPELRGAVEGVPSLAHQAANDIRTWWNGK